MTIKSVVDVPVNDAQFQRFAEKFAKYQAALAKVPGQWKDSAKAEGQAASEFEKILASFFAMGELQRELNDGSDKDNKNLQKKSSLWQGIRKSTKGVLDDVDKITKTLLKWGLIGFGAGVAGLFGVRAVAESVSADRRFALGTGLTIGAQQAFGRHQGRLLEDPSQFLTAAFSARSDVSSPAFSALAGLGISRDQSTVAIANQVLTKLQAEAKRTPQQFLGTLLAKYPGLSQFGVGLNTLEQLRTISSGELQGQIKAYAPDFAQTQMSDKQGKAFTDFVSSIDTSLDSLKRNFEKDLIPLLPAIQDFIHRISQDLNIFLKSDAAKKGLDAFAAGIENAARYLGSKDFQQGLTNFVSNVGGLAKAIGFVVSPVESTSATVGAAQEAAAAAGFGIPNAVLRGQKGLGGDLGQITKRDAEIMSNLGFVPAQDRLKVMLADFYLSQQRGFNENEFLHSVRSNVYLGNDALKGQPKAALHYAAQALKVTITTPPGSNLNATATLLGPGVAQ